MNGRIRDLMLEAGYAAPELAERAQKLAQSIIKECMNLCDTTHEMYGMAPDTARISKKMMKQHFGVEE